ncbi:MAG: M20/M25/M40 family metallo-hydrolase [Deltaproteobacteria bacterium]|nr:M20/M25/M40 family metallo-hydrolase [Deltaproteobacteria bacterium]
MEQKSYSGHFLPLSEKEKEISSNLRKHVYTLADAIGERNIWKPAKLNSAAEYIEENWQAQKYTVRRQEYDARGVPVFNLEIEIPGVSKTDEIIVIGAHYDSVHGCPGANDNGSGVAALLEISRLLASQKHSRTIRLVAFTNEEPPFFLRRDMGSKVYASRARKRNDNIVAMLSLETMGYYSEKPCSQKYPFPFSFFYPHTANFIGFVGNLRSRQLVKQSLAAFRRHTKFPSEGTSAPGWITGIGWSDHWSFWSQGYRAIMVTDTALFRYDYYHTSQDTPEKVDYDRLARVTKGLSQVVIELANSK